MTAQNSQIGFGGGCHWCTEAVFSSLRGMHRVQQGFIRSHTPDEQYSEAVLVDYDKNQISLAQLVEIHLRTHASTSSHSMREKYRSAIYVNNSETANECTALISTLQVQFENPLVTRVLENVQFKSSPESYTNYYATDPSRPFCRTYIKPKLALLRRDFKSCVTPASS